MGGRPRRPVKALIVQAMEAECAPVRDALGIDGPGRQLHPAFPARLWERGEVAVAVNGLDPRFGVDSIGGQPAVTTTLHAIESGSRTSSSRPEPPAASLREALEIGSIYLADRCVFHDRRIAIDGFDRYGDWRLSRGRHSRPQLASSVRPRHRLDGQCARRPCCRPRQHGGDGSRGQGHGSGIGRLGL